MSSFVSYYKRLFHQACRDFLRWGAQQVIGVILAFAILVLQLHFHLIPQQLSLPAFESIAWPYVVLTGVLIVVALINAPVKLDLQRAAQLNIRDEQIADLRSSVAAHNAEKSAISFRFHFEANPSARTDIKMRYLDTSLTVGVSTLELVVTNTGSHPFDLLACRYFREEIPIHRTVSAHAAARVNITREIVAAIVGDDFGSSPITETTSSLPMEISCQSENEQPIWSEPTIVQIEVVRATKALNVRIR